MAEPATVPETDEPIPTPPTDLVHDDGEPLESAWHRDQMNLLIDLLDQAMAERGRDDTYAGGNMFIYYSAEQAEAVRTQPIAATRHFRGPDVFFVAGTDGVRERRSWIVWEEDGRYPDLIVELLSPRTARIDRTVKKTIYERTFRTPDYVLYDRNHDRLEGFHLGVENRYLAIEPDPRGWLWIPSLELWLGRWQGLHRRLETTWIRLFDRGGRMVPTRAEAAELRTQVAQAETQTAQAETQAARAQADAERRRADAAEAELARLRAERQRPSGHS